MNFCFLVDVVLSKPARIDSDATDVLVQRTNAPAGDRPETGSLAVAANFVPMGGAAFGPAPVDWKTAMKRAIRDPNELLDHLGLAGAIALAERREFPTFVPLEFLARMRSGDADDPLLRQVLPVAEEDVDVPGFVTDPVGDLDAAACDSLLHKYDGRALMITTSACGVHCRYCFRREFPYTEAASRSTQWRPALDYLRRNPGIDEVLLSGGDPLTLVDDVLFDLLDQLDQIEHVQRIRLHSRMPIVIPQRVDEQLVAKLRSLRSTAWMVIHCNHAQEIDAAVADSIARMVDGGIPVLNQAVLLESVNDSVDALEQLCRTLVNLRVQPYYLHQLDRVRGAAHFEVCRDVGLRLMQELRNRLPGYAMPTYVSENAGEQSKRLVD